MWCHRIVRFFLKNFNLVPGVSGFSWESHAGLFCGSLFANIYIYIYTYRYNSCFFQFSTRRIRILMRFIVSTMLLPGTNRKSHGLNSCALTKFQNSLKILWHPISNWLYVFFVCLSWHMWFSSRADLVKVCWSLFVVSNVLFCTSLLTLVARRLGPRVQVSFRRVK